MLPSMSSSYDLLRTSRTKTDFLLTVTNKWDNVKVTHISKYNIDPSHILTLLR